MGREARARGTYEQRKAAAIIRDAEKLRIWREERQAAEDAKSEKQKIEDARGREVLNLLFHMLQTRNGININGRY